jgi:hypothetical protein
MLSLILREEYGLRVFENRFLRRIFAPKRDEVTGEWRNLHSEDLHTLYSFPNIRQVKLRSVMWAGHVACMGEERKVYMVLVGMHEGKRPLGRLWCRWEDGIRMYLREIGGGEWILLAQDRDQWHACVNNGYEHLGSGTTELVVLSCAVIYVV